MRRRRFLLLPVTALAGVLGVLPASAADFPGVPVVGATPISYVAVIDAGSSGTRLALFETAAAPQVTRVYRAPTNTPGLSSFADDPAAAGPDAVTPLLDELRTHLEGEGIAVSDVPVALLATAGMRRLKLNDPVATRGIFASTRTAIETSGFPLRTNKILPDFQEALLGWLDANAHAGTLSTPSKGIGIVEVGGASAQVAFRSPRASGPGVRSVTVSGRDISVVAISYLGLGSNDARGFMQVATSGGKVCFPNNSSGTDPVDYLALSDLPVPSAEADFVGTACRKAYTGVVEQVASLYPREVRPRNLSKLPGFARADFVGLGAIPFIYSDFTIPADADERRALQAAVRANCKGVDAWTKVRALFPADAQDFAETQCSSGTYLDRLFFGTAGIGLNPERFEAQPDLPGGDPSWSEGYAITVLHP